MNDKIFLLSTAIFALFFFVSGLLDILNHFLVKTILFVGFFAIVINIILVVKSKSKDKKKLPPDSSR
ncbi:MAG: hypothetical protein DRI75_03160 [Bacteroidetes bacterium]|nr:MAG: hypothetical protein DRI75_03160 [Bacteroidota bacterium]